MDLPANHTALQQHADKENTVVGARAIYLRPLKPAYCHNSNYERHLLVAWQGIQETNFLYISTDRLVLLGHEQHSHASYAQHKCSLD